MSSIYREIWKSELKKKGYPVRYKGLIKLQYEDLKKLKDQNNIDDGIKIITKLANGYVSANMLSLKNLSLMLKKIKLFWKNNPNTFHKMLEGCPDYHRIITPEIAKNYSVGAVRHTTYFFKWNKDPCNILEPIYERWRYSKYLAGLDFQFENNTPKDGIIDRVQIVCYPPRYGGVEVHRDTIGNNPLAISCYLSSLKSKDFKSGGFYCVDKKNKKINLKSHINTGDISLYCASIDHGVDSVDQDSDYRDYDWYSGEGRWWMGLFTNDSNVKKNRNTSVSLDTYHAEKFIKKK